MDEYKKIMDSRISDIEAEIGSRLSTGYEPELLIANDRTIREIMEHMIDEDQLKTLNWREPIMLAFADGNILLRIIRTVDVPYGTVIVR